MVTNDPCKNNWGGDFFFPSYVNMSILVLVSVEIPNILFPEHHSHSLYLNFRYQSHSSLYEPTSLIMFSEPSVFL